MTVNLATTNCVTAHTASTPAVLTSESAAPQAISVQLPTVQETQLIPLLARAVEASKAKPVLRDEKAIGILRQLNYDFAKWQKSGSLFVNVLRTCMFDEEVSAFLRLHPHGTIVELGCGLNTRFERLDNGTAHWLELDLPESLRLRRHFFQEHPRRRMLEANLLDPSWHALVASYPGPICFVAEAVLIYVEASALQPALERLAERFVGAWLVTDTTTGKVVDAQAEHDLMRRLPQASWYCWRCEDPALLQPWGLSLQRSRTLLDASTPLKRCMPPLLRWLARFAPGLLRRRAAGYRFNRFQLVMPARA